MFRHQGKARKLKHNLRIASLLSFIAGAVNITGFLAIGRMTSNVTGHFTSFVDDVFRLQLWEGLVYLFYVLFFFLGSFLTGLIIEFVARRKFNFLIYILPTVVESCILLAVAFGGDYLIQYQPQLLAFLLLLAMGLQNALVTRISNSVVRTTHLTGLFTDLGIELSQLLFYPKGNRIRQKLLKSIRLRLTIISSFFIGGLMGSLFYNRIGIKVLAAASIILLVGIFYDEVRLAILLLKRKHHNSNINTL